MYLSVMKCQDGISRFGAVREKVTGQPHGFLPRDRCGQRKIEPPVTFRPAASNRQAWTAVVADLPDREYSMSSVKTSAALAMIAITALAMSGDRERCIEAGADEYLAKPVSLKELLLEIENLLKE